MIPSEIAAIATLIWPYWSDLEKNDCLEVIAAAYRIHNAGYRISIDVSTPGESASE